jgi:Tfp pilus assembly PilM family ATPase
MQALAEALAAVPARSRQVHLILPNPLLLVRLMKLPDLGMDDLRRLVKFEMKHQMHVPFENPVFDLIKLTGSARGMPSKFAPARTELSSRREAEYELGWSEAAASGERAGRGEDWMADKLSGTADDEREEAANRCDVLLIIAPRAAIDAYASILRGCRLKPYSIEIKGLSLYRLIRAMYPEIKTAETFMLVDINETTADVSIIADGRLRLTRSANVAFQGGAADGASPAPMPMGGLFAEFEARERSSLERACEELAVELERMINFYRYTLNNRTNEIEAVVLTGDAANLQYIAAILNERIAPKVVVLRQLPDSSVPTAVYAVPIGLGLRGKAR